MKTFSIALGNFLVTDPATSGGALLASLGGPPPTILDNENKLEAENKAKALRATGAEPAAVEAGEVPPAMTMAVGDTISFSTDPEDYATCILAIHHADLSRHWVRLHRNSHVLASGYDKPPESPLTGSGAGGTEPAAEGAVVSPAPAGH